MFLNIHRCACNLSHIALYAAFATSSIDKDASIMTKRFGYRFANSKKVFLSNIKGKRSYWKNFAKATTPGRKVFGATQSCANAMSVIPILNLVSFVPLLGGAVIYTVNFAMAPVIAIFTKGGSLRIPAGSEFQIKITGDCQIKG